MDPMRKASLAFGSLLIAFGILFMAFAVIPGLSLGMAWPAIFYLLAAGFYLPVFLWPEIRKGLAALFIPGSILLVLGLIFTYNVLSEDWASWAYAWLLLVAGVGLGLALAAGFGGWGSTTLWVGVWMISISIGAFGLFATLFGSPLLKIVGAVLVMLVGVLLLIRSMRRG
jgi:hypothetical protein